MMTRAMMKKPTFTKMTTNTGAMNVHTKLLYGFNQHLQEDKSQSTSEELLFQTYTMSGTPVVSLAA